MKQVNLTTHVKNLLEEEQGCDISYIYEKDGYLYYWADHKFWQYPYIIRVEKEHFTTNHEYKHLDWDEWKKLRTEEENHERQ